MPETLIGKVVRRQSWLDPVSDVTKKLITASYRVLGPAGPPLRNLLHGTWLFRHPLHPAVTDVPVGAWTVGVVADYVAHFTSRIPESAGDVALAVGLVVALLALMTGYTDFGDTVGLERRFAIAHGLLMTIVVIIDAASLGLRWWGSQGVHPLAVALSTVGLAVLLLGAWIGGHVVFGIGYSVNHDAFLDGPEDWAAAGRADDVPAEGMHVVEAGGMRIMLARAGNRICALSATCTHAGGPLHEGVLEGGVVICPWHGSRFRIRDGRAIGGPATFDQPRLIVRDTDGRLEVKLEEPLHEP